MKQLSLPDSRFVKKPKITWRQVFLAKMEQVTSLITAVHPLPCSNDLAYLTLGWRSVARPACPACAHDAELRAPSCHHSSGAKKGANHINFIDIDQVLVGCSELP